MNDTTYFLGVVETFSLVVALCFILYITENKWFARLLRFLDQWHVLLPLFALTVIVLLIAALSYMTKTRPLHMVGVT